VAESGRYGDQGPKSFSETLDVSYVVWQYGAAVSSWVGTLTVPAVTGLQEYTAPGFEPTLALLLPFAEPTANTILTTDGANSTGFCAITASTQACIGAMSADAEGTTNTASFYDDVALESYNGSQIEDYKATFSQWTANGMELNYSNVEDGDLVGAFIASPALTGEAVSLTRRRRAPRSFQ
jgi:hypothetical protein